MKLIKKIKGLNDFHLCRGLEVLVYKDKMQFDGNEFEQKVRQYYYVEKDNLIKWMNDGKLRYLYNNGVFEEEKVKYFNPIYFAPNVYYSSKDEDGLFKYSFMENGTEYLFEIESEKSLSRIEYNPGNSVLMIPTSGDRQLLFYTKTGERLWVYDEEDVVKGTALKIVRFPSVVDDVVVIISRIITEDIYKAQGFKIRTGEKLWELRDNDCPDDLFLGEDKKLYGCYSYYDNLMLYCIDPFSGKMEGFAVKTNDEGINVCPWNVSMHNNCLFYGSNRPGCELGVIDCGKRELVEAIPLKFKKGCQIGAPIVSDGKVYVFSRGAGELRVYEL